MTTAMSKARLLAEYPDLDELADAWPRLPEHARRTLVQVARLVNLVGQPGDGADARRHQRSGSDGVRAPVRVLMR